MKCSGLALCSFSDAQAPLQPRNFAIAGGGTPGDGPAMVARSKMPYQVTAPCTQSLCCAIAALSGDACAGVAGSNSFTLQVVAANAAKWPPAEPPQTMALDGSIPYSGAWARE